MRWDVGVSEEMRERRPGRKYISPYQWSVLGTYAWRHHLVCHIWRSLLSLVNSVKRGVEMRAGSGRSSRRVAPAETVWLRFRGTTPRHYELQAWLQMHRSFNLLSMLEKNCSQNFVLYVPAASKFLVQEKSQALFSPASNQDLDTQGVSNLANLLL